MVAVLWIRFLDSLGFWFCFKGFSFNDRILSYFSCYQLDCPGIPSWLVFLSNRNLI